MENLHDWVSTILTIVGACIAAYMGASRAIIRLEADVDHIKDDLANNVRPRIREIGNRTHDQQQAILKHDGRLMVLEDRIK